MRPRALARRRRQTRRTENWPLAAPASGGAKISCGGGGRHGYHAKMDAAFRTLLFAYGLALSCALQAEEVLRVLAWPGYADADLVAAFAQRHRVKVEVSLVDSDDALWQRMGARQGRDFDVFAVNTAELQRYIDAGIAAPLEYARLPGTQRQLPAFRDPAAIPGLSRAGVVYGVPYTYAAMGLIYDRKRVPVAPDSIAVLWDARYRGQVLAFDGSSHNFSLAALRLGLPPFRVRERDWSVLVQTLVALRRNVLGFYTRPEEVVELFRTNSVAIVFANYGDQQVAALRQAGADIGYVIPKEGALAWLDCWAISSKTPNRKLAEAWIDYTLEPQVSQQLTRRHGLANTLSGAWPGHAAAQLIWLEPVEDSERRAKLWERVISGDRPERLP